ncbi:MAG: FHA domain-containing protein, partial [Burkholderiaceae bacterium]
MPRMVLSLDGVVLREVNLSKERTTIGRRSHNDVVIDNLAVSGEHAVVYASGSDIYLEDLGSTNGTTVNGQPIKKHLLQSGDIVEIGKYRLKFLADGASGSDTEVDIDTSQPLRREFYGPGPATIQVRHPGGGVEEG